LIVSTETPDRCAKDRADLACLGDWNTVIGKRLAHCFEIAAQPGRVSPRISPSISRRSVVRP
jgi:hypothetical protein